MNTEYKKYFAFPFTVDKYDIYVFDNRNDMIADGGISPEFTRYAVAAINALHGKVEVASTFNVAAVRPYSYDKEDITVIDRFGTDVLRIRGWGRLQKLGEDGIAAQEWIGEQFAIALNTYDGLAG